MGYLLIDYITPLELVSHESRSACVIFWMRSIHWAQLPTTAPVDRSIFPWSARTVLWACVYICIQYIYTCIYIHVVQTRICWK